MFKNLSIIVCGFLLLAACNVQRKMRHDIDFSALKVSSDVNLNYVSRGELKAYARQIIAANRLDHYYIDRQWKIPSLDQLSPQQKIVAYILLDLRLAKIDKTYYNLVPEVSFLRRANSIENGMQKVGLDLMCLSTFRTACPIDKSLVAHVCIEKCADGGIYSIEVVTSINEQKMPSQQNVIVTSIGYAMKNVFEKLSSNNPHVPNKQK